MQGFGSPFQVKGTEKPISVTLASKDRYTEFPGGSATEAAGRKSHLSGQLVCLPATSS